MYKYRKLYKHKNIEIQFEKFDGMHKIGIELGFTMKVHHAGFTFAIDLYKYCFNIFIYDDRHWNYAKNRWYTIEEEELEDEITL
jgi:hypothetical protein